MGFVFLSSYNSSLKLYRKSPLRNVVTIIKSGMEHIYWLDDRHRVDVSRSSQSRSFTMMGASKSIHTFSYQRFDGIKCHKPKRTTLFMNLLKICLILELPSAIDIDAFPARRTFTMTLCAIFWALSYSSLYLRMINIRNVCRFGFCHLGHQVEDGFGSRDPGCGGVRGANAAIMLTCRRQRRRATWRAEKTSAERHKHDYIIMRSMVSDSVTPTVHFRDAIMTAFMEAVLHGRAKTREGSRDKCM